MGALSIGDFSRIWVEFSVDFSVCLGRLPLGGLRLVGRTWPCRHGYFSLFENSLLRRRLLHHIDCRLPSWLGSSVTWISELELGFNGDSARNSVRLSLRLQTISLRLRSSFHVALCPVTTLTCSACWLTVVWDALMSSISTSLQWLCFVVTSSVCRLTFINLELIATAMLRPSTFGYPVDFASLIDFHPPPVVSSRLRLALPWLTRVCHPLSSRWIRSQIDRGFSGTRRCFRPLNIAIELVSIDRIRLNSSYASRYRLVVRGRDASEKKV